MQLSLLDEALQGVGPNFDQRAEENDNRELAVNMLVLVSMLVVGIVSLKLLHRLRSNVDHLGAIGLSNTPGWSVGWFFVPLANLIKPLGATRETWQASIAPDAWQTETAPPVLGTWWFFWITASIVGRVASRLPSIAGNSIESLITATWVDMGHTTLTMMAAFMYWKVLSGITTAQTETYQSMAAESPPDQWKY